MSRLMSVSFTEQAVVERRKTVTRRKGWWVDKNGDRLLLHGHRLTLCRKVQGRKSGEPLVRLAEVEVVRVWREELGDLLRDEGWGDDVGAELAAEGFPDLTPEEFIRRYFTEAQGIYPDDYVTRIEWRYVCGSGFCECGGCVL